MYQLTIDVDDDPVAVTAHPNFDDAQHALLKYVVSADYYLQPTETSAAHTSYQLLRVAGLDDPTPTRAPRIIGKATITERRDAELPVASGCFAACDASRWIAEHAVTWLYGSTTDPGYHYPMAVLTMAHGEAHHLLCAGALLPEAARLAGTENANVPDRSAREALRRNAISSDTDPRDAAAITDAVSQLLPADAADHQAAALIWYYALVRWGANAP